MNVFFNYRDSLVKDNYYIEFVKKYSLLITRPFYLIYLFWQAICRYCTEPDNLPNGMMFDNDAPDLFFLKPKNV
jgi:hypothetical protein